MQPSVQLVGVCFTVGKAAPRRGVTHPPPSTTEVKERVEVYLCSPYGFSWSVLGPNLPPLYRADDADVAGNPPSHGTGAGGSLRELKLSGVCSCWTK
jgi:hypothetical protein